MVKLKEMFPTVECFVYSLGNKEYVAKFINYIEQITDVQFQRPLLARDESVIDETYNYKKSVKMNFPTIINALSDRYPALKDSKVQDYVLNNRFAFIDNSDVVWDIPEKWIAVSTYAYEPVIDIAESIPIPLRKNKFIQDFLTHSRFNVFREPEGYNEDERNMMYHNWMANCYAEVMPTNKKAMEDKFFITLQKALAKVKRSNTPFSEINMKNIKKALS